MEEKRVLRTKVTLAFGSSLTLPPGDYEGDNIPPQLEQEYEAGSPHVEEVLTRFEKPRQAHPVKEARRPKKAVTSADPEPEKVAPTASSHEPAE